MEFHHLFLLALVALEESDHVHAGVLGKESLALAEQIGHARGRANSLYILGRSAAGRGESAAGRALLEESLALYRQYADWDGIQWSLRALAYLFIDQGKVSMAARLLGLVT